MIPKKQIQTEEKKKWRMCNKLSLHIMITLRGIDSACKPIILSYFENSTNLNSFLMFASVMVVFNSVFFNLPTNARRFLCEKSKQTFCCSDFRMHLYRTRTREWTHSKMFWCVFFLLAIFGTFRAHVQKHEKNLHFCTLNLLFLLCSF